MRREFMVSHTDVRSLWEPAKLRFVPRGPKWLRPTIERAIRFVLRWSGAEIERTEKVRTFSVATGETLLERMRLSQRDMLMLYDQRAAVAFVGPDVLDELLRETQMMSLGWQSFEMRGHDGLKIVGVEIVCVPWLEGVLLVPEWRKPAPESERAG